MSTDSIPPEDQAMLDIKRGIAIAFAAVNVLPHDVETLIPNIGTVADALAEAQHHLAMARNLTDTALKALGWVVPDESDMGF